MLIRIKKKNPNKIDNRVVFNSVNRNTPALATIVTPKDNNRHHNLTNTLFHSILTGALFSVTKIN